MPSDSAPQRFSNTRVAELLARARKGSPEALGALLEEYRPYLLHIAFEELNSELRAKEGPSDLVQKSFLEAARDFGGFTTGDADDLRAWLRQILLNNIQDLRAGFQAEKRQVTREVAANESSVENVEPAADHTSPSGAAIAREHAAALDLALARLDPKDQRLMLMRHREGKTFAEIATELNLSEMAVRKRWARAVEELQALIRGTTNGENDGKG